MATPQEAVEAAIHETGIGRVLQKLQTARPPFYAGDRRQSLEELASKRPDVFERVIAYYLAGRSLSPKKLTAEDAINLVISAEVKAGSTFLHVFECEKCGNRAFSNISEEMSCSRCIQKELDAAIVHLPRRKGNTRICKGRLLDEGKLTAVYGEVTCKECIEVVEEFQQSYERKQLNRALDEARSIAKALRSELTSANEGKPVYTYVRRKQLDEMSEKELDSRIAVLSNLILTGLNIDLSTVLVGDEMNKVDRKNTILRMEMKLKLLSPFDFECAGCRAPASYTAMFKHDLPLCYQCTIEFINAPAAKDIFQVALDKCLEEGVFKRK